MTKQEIISQLAAAGATAVTVFEDNGQPSMIEVYKGEQFTAVDWEPGDDVGAVVERLKRWLATI